MTTPNAKVWKHLKIIKEAVADLGSLTDEGQDLSTRVEAGSVLWILSELAQEALTPLKKDLRTKALEELQGTSGTWTADGSGKGSAKVVVPSEALCIRKGTDPLTIKTHPHWSDCFEVVQQVKVRKDAQSAIIKMASGSERDDLLDLLESRSNTPRVSLKRDE